MRGASGADLPKDPFDEGGRSRLRPWMQPTVFAWAWIALALAALLPGLGAPFFSDDFVYLADNRRLAQIPLSKPWLFLRERTNAYEFLPLRDLSLRLDLALFGDWAPGYRLHNFVLYLLTALAAWWCAGELPRALRGPPRSTREEQRRAWAAALAVSLFAVHPAHVEGVVWVSGRKDLLSALFVLLALAASARALASEGSFRWRPAAAALALFTLALASKSASVGATLVVVLLVLRFLARSRQSAVLPRLGAAGLGIATAAIAVTWTRSALAHGADADIAPGELSQLPLGNLAHLQTVLLVLGSLSKIAVLPIRPRLIYDVASPGLSSWLSVGIGALVLILAVWGFLAAWRRGSILGASVVLFVASVLPYLQIVPFRTWSLACDRFVFIAVLAPALALSWFLSSRPNRRRWLALCGLLALSASITVAQSWRWREPIGLLQDAARLAPGEGEAQRLWIEGALIPEGRHEEALAAAAGVRDPLIGDALRRLVEASIAFEAGDLASARKASAGLELLGPGYGSIRLLGRLAAATGDDFEACRLLTWLLRHARTHQQQQEAESLLASVRARHARELKALRTAAANRPGDAVAAGNLANLELELFLLDEAEARLRQILERQPGLAVAHYNLGLTLLRQRRFREASRAIGTAVSLGLATPAALNNLGVAHLNSGRLDAAASAFSRAIELNPGDCDATVNLGRLHFARRDFDHARELLSRAQSQCPDRTSMFAELLLQQVQRVVP